ncbi:MAG: AAA family ATPase [Acidimicrobiia bacterium]|nr:AAA family ATPase [Acidimicrobiia bacterium]
MDVVRPGIVMLVGLPASGKSTLAAALVQLIPDSRVLNKDVVRSALFEPCDYSAAERSIAFSAMLDAARYHLGRGRVVVLDGLAFPRPGEEEAVAAVVSDTGAFVATIVCDVPIEVAEARADADAVAATHRAANRDGAAVRRVAAEMREPSGAYLTVDTTRPIDEAAALALAYIEESAQ